MNKNACDMTDVEHLYSSVLQGHWCSAPEIIITGAL